MSHSDEIEQRKCLLALKSKGFDPDIHGYCISFDGKFQKTYDATCVVEKIQTGWKYYVFERGEFRDYATFNKTRNALNNLYWIFVSPKPHYAVIYSAHGKGFNAFIDQVAQETDAFDFACKHLNIQSNRYCLEVGDRTHTEISEGWICRPSTAGWSIVWRNRGVDEILGEFESLSDALTFMFFLLTGAQTYEERYAEIHAAK